MIGLSDNIYVGDMDSYMKVQHDNDFKFIQACKTPCHEMAVGGTVDKSHPEYYVAKRDNSIILNMVDSESPFLFSGVLFDESLDFIYNNKDKSKILIHCNMGVSRSPSIALLYLAREKKIKNKTYQDAKRDFTELYPYYKPKNGIVQFLTMNWTAYIN